MDNTTLRDGVYRVRTRYLCAGFIVRGGKVVDCAPILRKKLEYWITVATWICEPPGA